MLTAWRKKWKAAALLRQLERQVRRFEGESGWRSPSENAAIQAMQRAIVGFRLRVERWDLKEKLSQNRSAADQDGVVAALERIGAMTAPWRAQCAPRGD